MNAQFWKIGELAEATGLTVRTLRHYDELGLLTPSYRTKGDHRLYTAEDVARLQQIVSLKGLGLNLEQIKSALTEPAFAPEKVLGMQLARVREQLKLQEDLHERLEGMQRFLAQRPLTAEEFLDAIKLMNEVEALYTEEEREIIRKQARSIGQGNIAAAEREWPQLIERMTAQLHKNAPPDDPETQALAKRWKELVEMFTGGDPRIAAKLTQMYREHPNAGQTFGGPSFDPRLFEYVEKAMQHRER